MAFYSVLLETPGSAAFLLAQTEVELLPHRTTADWLLLAEGMIILTSFLVAHPFRCHHQFFKGHQIQFSYFPLL